MFDTLVFFVVVKKEKNTGLISKILTTKTLNQTFLTITVKAVLMVAPTVRKK